LRGANKVVITSSTLLNGTLEGLLDVTREAGFRAVVGPGASFVPDPLFDRRVDVVGGMQVIDREKLISRQQNAERWGGATRKYLISAKAWGSVRDEKVLA
jgi:uncharacterized protein (DUF4213/DUF364 family)